MSNRPFIPAWLDDSDLTPTQFRVYCHIARRGKCFESLDSIAKCCRIRRETVQRTLKELADIGLLVATKRPGQIALLTCSQSYSPIAKEGLPTHSERGARSHSERGAGLAAHHNTLKGTPLRGDPFQRVEWSKELERIEDRLPHYRDALSPMTRARGKEMRERRDELRVLLGVRY